MTQPILIKTHWATELFGLYIWHSFDVDGTGGHPLSLVPNANIEDELRRFAKLVVLPEFTKRFDALRRERLKESFRYALNYLSDEDEYGSSLTIDLSPYLEFKETPEICYPRWSFWLIWDEMFPGESYEITDPSQYLLIYDRDISLYDDVFPEDGDYRPLAGPPPYKVTPPPNDWEPPHSSDMRVQTTPPTLKGLNDIQIAEQVVALAETEGFDNVVIGVRAYLDADDPKPYHLIVDAYKENGVANLRAINMFLTRLVRVFSWTVEHALNTLHDTLTEAQWAYYEGLSNYLDFLDFSLNQYPDDRPEEQNLRGLLDLFREEDTRQFPDPFV